MNNKILALIKAMAQLQLDHQASGIDSDIEAVKDALEIDDVRTARVRIEAASAKRKQFQKRARRLIRTGRRQFYQSLDTVYHEAEERGEHIKRREAVRLAGQIMNVPEKRPDPSDLLPFLKASQFLIRHYHEITP
jgi:hypothetical protein